MSTSLYTPIFPTSEAISAKLESLQQSKPKASPIKRKLPDSIGVARTRARTRDAKTVNSNASLNTSSSSTTISTTTSSSKSSLTSAKLPSSHTSSALKTPSTSKAASKRPSTSKTKPTTHAKKQKRHHYGSKLRKMHLALSRLPHELAPPSPTQSYASLPLPLVNGRSNGPVPLAGDSSSIPGLPLAPRTPKTNDARANNTKEGTITPDTTGDNRVDPKSVEDLTRKIRHAIRQANDDPTSPKWTHVHALVRMGCTTGRWLGVGGLTSAGRDRAGQMPYELEEEEAEDGEEAGEGPKRGKWPLAETEEEWEEWERRREEERKRRDAKGKGKASAFPTLASAPASALGPTGTVVLAGGASKGKKKQVDDVKRKSKKTDESSAVAKTTPAVHPAATATNGSTSTTVNPKTPSKAIMKPRSSATATTATTSIITGDTSSTTRPQATSTSVTSAATAYPSTSILTSPLASRTESVPANGLAPVAAAATVTPAPAQPVQITDETPAPAPVTVPVLPPASSQAEDIFGVPSTSQRIRAEVGRWKSSLTVQQQKKMDEIVRINAGCGEVLEAAEDEMAASSQSQPQSQDSQPQAQRQVQAQGKKQSPLEFAVRKQGAVANALGSKKDGKDKDKVKIVGKASKFFHANDAGPVAEAAERSGAGTGASAGDKEMGKEVEKELDAEEHDEAPDKSEGKAKEVVPEVEDEAQAQAEEAEVEAETQTDDATDAPKVSSIYDVPETFIPPSFSSDSILPSTPAIRVAPPPTEEPKTKPPPIAPVPDVLAGLEGELEKDGVVYPATQPSQPQHGYDPKEVDEHDERVVRAKKRARSSILDFPSKRSRLSPDSASEDESSSTNGHGGRGEENRMGTSLATSEVEPDASGEQAEGEGALEGDIDTQDSTPPGLGLLEKKDKGKGRETKPNEVSLFGGQGPASHAPRPLVLHAPQPTRPHDTPTRRLSLEPSDPEGCPENHGQERPHTPPPRPPTRVLGAAASPFAITKVPLGAPLTPSRPPKVLHLLASSRTSRPRPRPPSRHGNRTPGPAAKDKEGEGNEPPRVGADIDRPRTPDRSQSAIFSSPASGSTVSTASPNLRRGANMYMGGPESPLRERGRRFTSGLNFEASPPRLGSGATGSGLLKDVMPASDFTSLSGVFDPQMVSTQQRRNGEGGDIFPQRRAFAGMGESQSLPPSQEPSQDYGFSQSQGYGLGGMGMGYSSQFDVEGGVAETSVVLERDVDYGAWLRESPDLPDEKSVNEEKEVEDQVDMELA